MKIFGMIGIVILLGSLGMISFSNCGVSKSNDYWIITDGYIYIEDFHTENYTISENYITLHGYWITTSSKHQEDFIINLASVVEIWHGDTKIYPASEYLQVKRGWDNIRDGRLYLRNSLPLWPLTLLIVLILTGFFIFLLRKQILNIIKIKKINLPLPIRGKYWQDIKLPVETEGIIATRQWQFNNGVLCSPMKKFVWDKQQMISDELPLRNNIKGLYAYRLGTGSHRSYGNISGIVALTGKCIGHNDGLIRAEKCKIILLICQDIVMSRKLSALYNVPIILVMNNDERYEIFERFLISDEGIYHLFHNLRIIQGNENMDLQINEIIKQRGF